MSEMNEEQLDLEKVKRYDDSWWLHYLKGNTVFDTEQIKAQKDYLIEQAERVPELELNFKSLQQEWVRVVKENKRQREALEFYADSKNYEVNVVDQWGPEIKVMMDGGANAAKLLEELK